MASPGAGVFTPGRIRLKEIRADAISPADSLTWPLILTLRIFLARLEPNLKFHRQESPVFSGAHR